MSNKSIYEGELQDRATSTESLEIRLQLNNKFSSTNFQDWLMAKYNPQKGQDILDVGCGEGAQSIPFAERVGETGSVSSTDISASSIEKLRTKGAGFKNLQAVVGDMATVQSMIDNEFRIKKYDLAQSAYSLYYAADRSVVLDAMRKALKPEGRLAIFTPNEPHGMVNFVKQFTPVPQQVEDCFIFGPTVLLPYFRKNFWDVQIHLFHNVVTVPSVDDFLTFFRATTYYNQAVEKQVAEAVQKEIDKYGSMKYEKNGYLIVGSHPF
jgi:ubiquinone/menaquinone biosynthesis C-methylase UbiE